MNIAIIRGVLTKDVEVKKLPSGNSAANFYVAVRRSFKNADGNYDSDFISCKAFGNTADMIGKYFHKGSGIIVEGSIQTGSYEKEGQKVYTTDLIVSKVHFDRGNEKKEEKKEEVKEIKKLSDDPFKDFAAKVEIEEKMPWD